MGHIKLLLRIGLGLTTLSLRRGACSCGAVFHMRSLHYSLGVRVPLKSNARIRGESPARRNFQDKDPSRRFSWKDGVYGFALRSPGAALESAHSCSLLRGVRNGIFLHWTPEEWSY